MEELVTYAKRVAFRMSRDPEVESIAAKSAWRASETFDPTLGVPWKRWVARCVKQDIWCYWRQLKARREETRDNAFWLDVYKVKQQTKHTRKYELEPQLELDIPQEDWRLLTEKYIERWPLDVMAREYGVTIYTMRRMLADAVSRLEQYLAIGKSSE